MVLLVKGIIARVDYFLFGSHLLFFVLGVFFVLTEVLNTLDIRKPVLKGFLNLMVEIEKIFFGPFSVVLLTEGAVY